MFRHWLQRTSVPALATATLLFAGGAGLAQKGGGHSGGGHGGGGHASGGHSGGGHGGGHPGGGFSSGTHHGGHNGSFRHDGGFHHHSNFGFGAGFYPGYYGYGYGYSPYYSEPYYSAPYYNYPYRDYSYYGDVYSYTPRNYVIEPYNPGYYVPGMPSVVNTPSMINTPPVSTYQPAANGALFDVRVPPNADIWFQGQKTQQTGVARQYESPPLTPGSDYVFEVRARWTVNGQEFNQTRNVTVRAGDRMAINFLNQQLPQATAARPPVP